MILNYFKKENISSSIQQFFKELSVPFNPLSGEAIPKNKFFEKEIDSTVKYLSSVDTLYLPITIAESAFQKNLFDEKINSKTIKEDYQGYLVFGIEIKKSERPISLSELANITRAVSREMKNNPVVVFFLTGGKLSIANCERTPYKRDREGEKPGKVSILRDIDLEKPHAGHIKILLDLRIQTKNINSFRELNKHWLEVFNLKTLNKKFYEEIFYWYLWAVREVKFPQIRPAEDMVDDKIHQSESVIRLLTRLIFCWFLKEKGNLIPEAIFEEEKVSEMLKNFQSNKGKDTVYYRAILQNLFFATLSFPIEKRKYIGESYQGKNPNYGNQYVFRYQDYFVNPEKNLEIFKNIPFLNGGLFESLDIKKDEHNPIEIRLDGFSKEEKKQAKVPDVLFWGGAKKLDFTKDLDNAKAKDIESKGLIEILKSYKFTIEENTALDEEIALDPELLGKIFENLLASFNPETRETARKQTGSFYTPREEVDYMVEESLIAILKEKLSVQPAGHVNLRNETSLFENTSDKKGQMSLETKIHKPKYTSKEWESKLRELFSESNHDNPFDKEVTPRVVEIIQSLKILDPACGSGAFPMGILNKMILAFRKLDPDNSFLKYNWAKEKLIEEKFSLKEKFEEIEKNRNAIKQITIDDIRNDALLKLDSEEKKILDSISNYKVEYARKLYLIENCIYGIDIQPIAVQIAKLRFFISLLVGQEHNTDSSKNFGLLPLPNLDLKIVCANTLIAAPKERMSKENVTHTESMFQNQKDLFLESFREESSKYFNSYDPEKKGKVRDKLKELISKKVKEKIDEIESLSGKTELEKKILKERRKEEIETKKEEILLWKSYPNLFKHETVGFFETKYFFPAANKGFDIVIGNPPYVQLQKIKEIANRLQKEGYETFARTGDIYCLFYEKGMNLLKPKGILTYITSNSWMRTQYGEPLRKLFWEKTNPLQLINFEDAQMFESAIVETNIFITMRDKNDNAMIAATVGNPSNTKTQSSIVGTGRDLSLREMVVANSIVLSNLGSKSWSIGDTAGNAIQEKIEKNGILVIDLDVKINFGIKTGYDNAFIINDETKNYLVKADKKNIKIIKPIIRGKDVNKYFYNFEEQWLILSHNGVRDYSYKGNDWEKKYKILPVDIKKDYPEIYKYFSKKDFQPMIKDRQDQGDHWTNLRHCAYLEDFQKEKIIWGMLSDESKFTIDTEGYYVNAKVFIMTGKHLHFLVGVFNSNIIKWYNSIITTTTGMGTTQWLKYTVEQLPIPRSPIDKPALQKPLIALVDKILAAKGKDPLADISKWENEIDARVFHLYGLTEEEMLTVLNSFPKLSSMEKTQIQNFYRDLERGNLV